MKRLSLQYYQSEDVVTLAKDLLGKIIRTKIDGKITSGEIVETECYHGVKDRACHAYNNRKTKRTDVMYQVGGVSYIYLCYGIHHLFNIITGPKGMPHAVLVRAIKPIEGIEIMLKRRKKLQLKRSLCAGPGALSQALGLDCSYNGTSLISEQIGIFSGEAKSKEIITSTRVGISYAKEDALLPYRFRIKDSLWTSLAK